MSIDETRPRMSRRAVKDALTAELLVELRHMAQTQTEWTEQLAGQVINHVLEVRTITFDATGQYPLQWKVAAGSIEVSNPTGNGTVTVSSGGSNSTTAPPTGVGVYQVPGGTCRTVSVASRQVTLYGTAGQSISIQVFTAAVRPGTGS